MEKMFNMGVGMIVVVVFEDMMCVLVVLIVWYLDCWVLGIVCKGGK